MDLELFLSDGAGAPSLEQCRIHAPWSTGELDTRNQSVGDSPGETETYASVSASPRHSLRRWRITRGVIITELVVLLMWF